MTALDDWSYSAEALEVLADFYGANFVVFVEGKDDIPFWSTLFEKTGVTNFHIDHKDGYDELRKVMTYIIDEDAMVIAACDATYQVLLNRLPTHVRILSTFGHSIENTMYCPAILNIVIKKLCRDLQNRTGKVSEWISKFCDDCADLITYDLAREKYGKSIQVIPDNCMRFLKSSHSTDLDEQKICTHLQSISFNFNKTELSECKRLISSSGKEMRYVIRGHFLTNAAINVVKKQVKATNGHLPAIPLDIWYALTSDACKLCCENCEEFNWISEKIKSAVVSLKMSM